MHIFPYTLLYLNNYCTLHLNSSCHRLRPLVSLKDLILLHKLIRALPLGTQLVSQYFFRSSRIHKRFHKDLLSAVKVLQSLELDVEIS